MVDPAVNKPVQQPTGTVPLTFEGLLSAMWESAVDAFVKALLILLLGSVALGITSGIWSEMMPSAPPGFGVGLELEARAWRAWVASFNEHRLAIVFAVVFVPTLWAGSPVETLARRSKGTPGPRR